MALFQQRRVSIISLVLYWPMLLVFAHIPIPESVRSANVSDKSLHFLAYLVLTFLLWFSIKPQEKVNWRKIPVWFVLFGLILYGVADEIVQSHIGRSCDPMDVVANFSGIFFCLLLLTFLTFLPAALLIAGIVIFGMANVSRTNLAEIFPVAYGVFDLLAYTIFTVFWLLNMNLFFQKKPAKLQRLILAVSMPVSFLLIVRIFSIMLGRETSAEDIIIPAVTIFVVTAADYVRIVFWNKAEKSPQTDNSVSS